MTDNYADLYLKESIESLESAQRRLQRAIKCGLEKTQREDAEKARINISASIGYLNKILLEAF
jgi:hypothetical protein